MWSHGALGEDQAIPADAYTFQTALGKARSELSFNSGFKQRAAQVYHLYAHSYLGALTASGRLVGQCATS